MYCNRGKDNCVCKIVRKILEKQEKISDGCSSCETSIEELRTQQINQNLNTIPFLLTCSDGCGYYIASGVFKEPSTAVFQCFETPVFRVSKLIKNTCCAELELLQPLTAQGTVPGFTNTCGVCRFFPANLITQFIRTGVCIHVDLNCYCVIECLPAVNAEIGTPVIPDVCQNPVVTVDAPDFTCIGIITGTVTCDGEPIPNAPVFLTSSPPIINFDTNPVFTDDEGNYSVIASVSPGTEETEVTITATTFVNGITDSDTDTATVSCPANGNACEGCGIHVGTEVSGTTVTVETDEGQQQFTGTLNLNALSCGGECNPANNNFNIQFIGTGEDTGTIINFINGRRETVTCDPPNSVTITGPARVAGNNPYPNNRIFTVTIELTDAATDPGSWDISADDGMGNTFQATFTGNVNPNVIVDCNGATELEKKSLVKRIFNKKK